MKFVSHKMFVNICLIAINSTNQELSFLSKDFLLFCTERLCQIGQKASNNYYILHQHTDPCHLIGGIRVTWHPLFLPCIYCYNAPKTNIGVQYGKLLDASRHHSQNNGSMPVCTIEAKSYHGGQGWCLYGVIHIVERWIFFKIFQKVRVDEFPRPLCVYFLKNF